ncbi:hypothetical protein JCM10213v2_004449 [Rhodosporidiobolus nylandii]
MQSSSLQPGPRKLKKGGDKDKLKNRMSMAFRKPFTGKDKNKVSPFDDPSVSPTPAPGPPAYSAAAPAPHSRSSALESGRRASNCAGRSNKPVPHQTDGLVSRRSHVGAGAVGTSPPLPPLPRNGSLEGPSDPRVTALLGGSVALAVNDLLPRHSFGPAFELEMPMHGGLGIGMEASPPQKHQQQHHSPPRQLSPPPSRSPPPSLPQPQPRLQTPPLQRHQQSTSHYQQQQHSGCSAPAPHHLHEAVPQRGQTPPVQRSVSPPILARPTTAPDLPEQGTYLTRRLSVIAQGGELSAANKRLSMMKRGPPVFGSSSANSSSSTLESAAATAAHAVEQLASPPQMQASKRFSPPAASIAAPAPVLPAAASPPKVLLDEDDVASLSASSRDRILKLRGVRASISAAPPTAAQVHALKGANRKDATKAYSLASAPQGFDISLVGGNKSTFTPAALRPLALSSAAVAARSSSPLGALSPAATPAPPAAPQKDLSMYVLRPTVSMATQTPTWPEPAPLRANRAFSRGQLWAASTPPQPYASFPAPSVHDSPPQQHSQVSPSIYSIASFDARSRNLRGSRAGRSSFYADGEILNEGDEYEYGEEPPLPEDAPNTVEQHIAALEEELYAQGYAHAGQPELVEQVSYDLPYLPAELYDSPHLRPYDIPATPLPLAVPDRPDSAAASRSSLALTDVDRTPSVTPTPYAAPKFSTPQPFHTAVSSLPSDVLKIPESPRSSSRSRSPSPASHAVPSLSRSLSSSSASSNEDGTVSSASRPPSSLANRRSSSEPMTPPTSAVSSIFPDNLHEHIDGAYAKDGGESPEHGDNPVVTIRKASIIMSQVRKASLITPPSSRPQSVVLRKGSLASLVSGGDSRRCSQASSEGGASILSSAAGHSSPSHKGERSPRAHFQLDLPGADQPPPVPAVPSPIRRAFGEAAFPFPGQSSASPASEEQGEKPASPAPLPTPLRESSALASIPRLPPVVAAVDFWQERPASAPPEESATLPLRRQSESDKPVLRPRMPGGMMSREERAAKGRSYFLVQALMGESQPEGMIRDWAKDEGSDDDDSLLESEEEEDEIDLDEEYIPSL